MVYSSKLGKYKIKHFRKIEHIQSFLKQDIVKLIVKEKLIGLS